MKKVTISTLLQKKQKKEKVVFATCYDFPMASFANEAGIDMILVGDSGVMAALGHKTTVSATMEEMLFMIGAVARANKSSFLVGDMPFLSYQTSEYDAVKNAGLMIKAGCDAVKCEGGIRIAPKIKAMVDAGIAVMGHIGLTPQNMSQLGGYKVQGKTLESYKSLLADALAVQEAGAFSILLEAIPNDVAKKITEKLSIPCYGIGAGYDVDGQLVISHDILGMFVGDVKPKFIKPFANVGAHIVEAYKNYAKEVRAKKFPAEEHCYDIDKAELEKILKD